MDNDKLKKLIYQLEQELMRLDRDQLALLLADDFVEFGSSGNTYTKHEQVIYSEQKSNLPHYNISDFMIKEITPGIVLATYRTLRTHDNQQALRSSIWRLTNQSWQMVFHQGTPVAVE
ncbi:hypothetical protein D3C73_491280 [compost metagenome]